MLKAGGTATSRANPAPPESYPVITFLLVVHALITIGLVGVILLQRSEGGGLGIGGGTGGGLMTARGAANLLTRSTTVLAIMFIGSSIVLAVLAAGSNKAKPIDTSLVAPASTTSVPAPGGVPLVPGARPVAPATAPAQAPAPAPESGVPLAR